MPRECFPRRESALVVWVTNLDARVAAAPADYGVPVELAAELTARRAAFVASYQACRGGGTRTPEMIQLKNLQKDAMIATVRKVSRLVQAAPGMTNDVRARLGLSLRREGKAPPIPAPVLAPEVDVEGVRGRVVAVRLHNKAALGSRARPAGVKGAMVYRYVGRMPPTRVEDWVLVGNTTRTRLAIEFPDTAPAGAQVWITACWFNPTAKNGPIGGPATTFLQYGGLQSAA